ncbi:hypothetical protein GH714_003591 [Hevea brasiliensis]|uniref:RRM domain-containing protein n=1 Tax=Hevea brasiliensis TaxID=3981 RepID=A0A6A6LV02_HEVBR|nr:hypothetical protein GH714_003591 [Hevea brasiliensis]
MDFTKKRKADENGTAIIPTLSTAATSTALTPQDIRKVIDPFTKEQLLDILQTAAVRHPDVLDSIRIVADGDISLRKLFIRGLSTNTTTETISLFFAYGELEEAVVIFDKNTGKSKGFGFITFKHVDGALIALKEPSKKIDGRMTVTQLASAGLSNSGSSGGDVWSRKIYVGNVPYDIPQRDFLCKMAVDNKKAKTEGGVVGDNAQPQPPPQPQSSMPGSQYGVPGSLPPYGGFSGLGSSGYGLNSSLPGSIGSGGYGGPYGVSQFGGPSSGEFGGLNSAGNSMYRMPPSSVGMASGGYPDGAPYGLSQQHQPSPLPPRVPPGGMYQGMPPYY